LASGALVSSYLLAVGLSAGLLINNLVVRLIVVAVGLIGVWYVGIHVPTRERVLAEREMTGVAVPPAAEL